MEHFIIHPSKLGIGCKRFYWRERHSLPPEVMPTASTDQGISVEQVLNTALLEKRSSYEIEGKEYNIPPVLLNSNFRLQESIVYDIENFRIRGRADYVSVPTGLDSIITVCEFKSFATQILQTHQLQLLCYAFKYINAADCVKTLVFFIRHGWLENCDTFTELDSGVVRKRLLTEFKRIKNITELEHEPVARGGWFCDYCPYPLSCISRPTIFDEDIKSMSDNIFKLRSAVSAIENRLKAYVAKNGNIVTEHGEIGYFDRTTHEVDAKILEELAKRDIKFLPYMNFNIYKLKKLIKQIPDFQSFMSIVPNKPRFDIKATRKPRGEEQPLNEGGSNE